MNPLSVSLDHFIALSALVFGLGLLGLILNRSHLIKTLLSIELMLLGVNIAFIAFGLHHHNLIGQVFSIFVLSVAAAEIAIGLAILIIYYRHHHSINIVDLTELRG